MDAMLPMDELIPLVLVSGRRDAGLIKRAEKVRIAGTKPRERRMVVRGGIPAHTSIDHRICVECACASIAGIPKVIYAMISYSINLCAPVVQR
jgi:hypothetical protein